MVGIRSTALPTMFCWQIAGPRGPSLRLALRFGEAVRSAVMRSGNRVGLSRLPDTFHGGAGDATHSHAYWLSEDRDGDGYIDHVTVYARSGIPQSVVAALAGVDQVWLDERVVWHMVPMILGRPTTGGLLGPSRRWMAATAYITPLHRTDPTGATRPHLGPDGQFRNELARRELPAPLSICWSEGIMLRQGQIAARSFVRSGSGRRAPPGAWLGAPALIFDQPVAGPLAFGFGAHFGLGLLVPAPPAPPSPLAARNVATLRRRGLLPALPDPRHDD